MTKTNIKNLLLLFAFASSLASIPFFAKAAHEGDGDLSTPDNQELLIPESLDSVTHVTINGLPYLQKTVPIPDFCKKNRTTIYTPEGTHVGHIDYPDHFTAYHRFESVEYGYISWVMVARPFRGNKGVGRYLVNLVHDFYQKKNIPFVKLLAFPADITEEDLKLSPAQRMDKLVRYYKSLGYQQVGQQDEEGGTPMKCYLPQIT